MILLNNCWVIQQSLTHSPVIIVLSKCHCIVYISLYCLNVIVLSKCHCIVYISLYCLNVIVLSKCHCIVYTSLYCLHFIVLSKFHCIVYISNSQLGLQYWSQFILYECEMAPSLEVNGKYISPSINRNIGASLMLRFTKFQIQTKRNQRFSIR